MKTTLDILVAARAMIEKPENWCQHYVALDANGKPVDSNDRRAVRHCAAGALWAIASFAYPKGACDALNAAAGTPNQLSGFVEFNNTHTHPEVLALFDRAIAAEKRKLGIDDRITAQVRSLMGSASNSKQLIDAPEGGQS